MALAQDARLARGTGSPVGLSDGEKGITSEIVYAHAELALYTTGYTVSQSAGSVDSE